MDDEFGGGVDVVVGGGAVDERGEVVPEAPVGDLGAEVVDRFARGEPVGAVGRERGEDVVGREAEAGEREGADLGGDQFGGPEGADLAGARPPAGCRWVGWCRGGGRGRRVGRPGWG